MNEMLKKGSHLILGLYGFFMLILFVFGFLWDNKGNDSIWEKSPSDWLFLIWLLFGCLLISYTVYISINKNKNAQILYVLICVLIAVNTKILVFGGSEGDEVFIEFAVVNFLGIMSSIYLFFRERMSLHHIN